MVNIAVPHRGRLINKDYIVVDELPEYTKKFGIKKNLRSLCKTKISLADKNFDLLVEKQSPTELLIGIDYVYNILHPGFRKFENLILLPTIFGYVVTGPCSSPPTKETYVSILKLAVETDNIIMAEGATQLKDPREDLESLWSLDHLSVDCSEITEQKWKVLENFESTITYSEIDKQYVVALSWNGNKRRLTSNFGLALNRLEQQCVKCQDTQYLERYQKILKGQEDRRFIERVEYFKTEDCHFLAHHGVKKDSATTSIKIVFDCSVRQGEGGLSLNDCLWMGRHITADLLKVLLQFRAKDVPAEFVKAAIGLG
ncbi:uncharacterized protein [Macrobrachium rosenbergii]|uniref:uncharacterized protein n=1 Tax=Macrobrachium rosenbergii TaxID=79674 RepID=UPI0034D50C2C